MTKLWPLTGGIYPRSHKQESADSALTIAALPSTLSYPLLQRNGYYIKPLVSAGEYIFKGQIVAVPDDKLCPPIHAASSGWVRGIEQSLLPYPSGLAGDFIVIQTDGKDAALEYPQVADYPNLSLDELRVLIHWAGIVGLGGAGFPTAIKMDIGQRDIDTLILNGTECEPYITSDDSLLRNFPLEVLSGAKILLHSLGVKRCLLAVEDNMSAAKAALEGVKVTGSYDEIDIVAVPTIYPAGGERQLISTLTGKEVPAQGIPADIGIVCQNVATSAAIYHAVIKGEPLLSRIVTVTGQGVCSPQNFIARIGTPIADLIAQAGGYTALAQRLIMGGPMMGFALPSDDIPIVKTTNCILVASANETLGQKQAKPCIRCGECVSVCPASLLPQQLYWYSRAGNSQKLAEYHLADCIECGCCDVVCPSHIPLVQHFQAAKIQSSRQAQEKQRADHARFRYEAKQARTEAEKLEKAESMQRKKELLAKIAADQQKG